MLINYHYKKGDEKMKKAFISTVSLALVFSMALSFASCDGDDDVTKDQSTQTNAPQATEKQTEKATDAQTDTPDESEPTEDTATNAAVTNAPITNSPVTTPETKAPATTAPGQDPNVDYSHWGKHGFENLLPIPLPFSDEEADWVSREYSLDHYSIKNNKKIRLDDPDDFPRIFKEYVESFEDYGYSVMPEQYGLGAQYKMEHKVDFKCEDGYVTIDIYYLS
jgi:hypothetical protein